MKFYDLPDPNGVRYGVKAYLRKVHNSHDPNCIGVFVERGSNRLQLGHVAAEVAPYLCSVIPSYRITW